MNNELVVLKHPKADISESIRTIRTNLQFSAIDQDLNTILVTSTIPGEGKSFISANLAVAFAQNNIRVLLLDCDMRKGRSHKIFGLDNEVGLSNLLLDDIDNYKSYIKKTSIDNLYVLTSGIVPPNPSELLNSIKNRDLLKKLKDRFDLIILDGVPISGLPDSLILSTIVDKVVIVSSLKITPKDLLMRTKKSLENVGANIAGIVVNRVPQAGTDYYYYGNYYSNTEK